MKALRELSWPHLVNTNRLYSTRSIPILKEEKSSSSLHIEKVIAYDTRDRRLSEQSEHDSEPMRVLSPRPDIDSYPLVPASIRGGIHQCCKDSPRLLPHLAICETELDIGENINIPLPPSSIVEATHTTVLNREYPPTIPDTPTNLSVRGSEPTFAKEASALCEKQNIQPVSQLDTIKTVLAPERPFNPSWPQSSSNSNISKTDSIPLQLVPEDPIINTPRKNTVPNFVAKTMESSAMKTCELATNPAPTPPESVSNVDNDAVPLDSVHVMDITPDIPSSADGPKLADTNIPMSVIKSVPMTNSLPTDDVPAVPRIQDVSKAIPDAPKLQSLAIPIDQTGTIPAPPTPKSNVTKKQKARIRTQKMIRRSRRIVLRKSVLSLVLGRQLAGPVVDTLKLISSKGDIDAIGGVTGMVTGAAPVPIPAPIPI